MLPHLQGNLLRSEAEAEAEALVNTVNTIGISGKGIALMFKHAFPDNFSAYAAACKVAQLAPGGLFITERHDMFGPRLIIKFAPSSIGASHRAWNGSVRDSRHSKRK